jgi:nucleoside phosphorylase
MARSEAREAFSPASPQARKERFAVVLCALPVEYSAIRSLLSELRDATEGGPKQEVGVYRASDATWQVLISATQHGNVTAATAATRALEHFKPDLAMYVGIAGGFAEKGVRHGDVVVGTEVFSYHSGRAGKTFATRPTAFSGDRELISHSNYLAGLADATLPPHDDYRIHVGAIVSGEHLVRASDSETARLIRGTYEQALAVEMEGYGFLAAASAVRGLRAVVVRGISDLLDDKTAEADEEWQPRAARNAAHFAFRLLAEVAETGGPSGIRVGSRLTGGSLTRETALVALGSSDLSESRAGAAHLVRTALDAERKDSLLPVQVIESRGEIEVVWGAAAEHRGALTVDEVRSWVAAGPDIIEARVLGRAFGVDIRQASQAEPSSRESLRALRGDDTVETERTDIIRAHLRAGRDVVLVGDSASGKTVAAIQAMTSVQQFGWSAGYFDLAQPDVDELSVIRSASKAAPGSAGVHVWVVDNVQASPGKAERMLRVIERLRPLLGVQAQVVAVTWNSASGVVTGVLPNAAFVQCSGRDVLQEIATGLAPELADAARVRELSRLSRGDLLIAHLALEHLHVAGDLPTPREIASSAFDLIRGTTVFSSEALRCAYHIAALGQFEVETDRSYAEQLSREGLAELLASGLVRLDGNYVSIGHRTMATLVAAHLRSEHGEVVGDLPPPVRLAVSYLKSAGDSQIMAMLQRLDLAQLQQSEADQHGSAFLAKAWDAARVLTLYLSRQVQGDVTWGDNIASAVKASEALGRFDAGGWEDTAKYVRSRWSIGDGRRLPEPEGQPSAERVDFDEIAKTMAEEDGRYPSAPATWIPAAEVDLDTFHRSWVLGLLLGFEGRAAIQDRARVEVLLEAARVAQDPEGFFYPRRVPWVTARVLSGLASVGQDLTNSDIARRAADWLRRPSPSGPCQLGVWESGTGTWNTALGTTAMCLRALVAVGVDSEDVAIRSGLAYLVGRRGAWLKSGNEIDTADAIEAYLLTGGTWRDVRQELGYLLQWARDPEHWSHASDLASESQDESSKVPAIASALIDIVWAMVKVELPLLLEGVAMDIGAILTHDRKATNGRPL